MVENSFFSRFFGLLDSFFSFFFGPTSVIFKKKVLATLKRSRQVKNVIKKNYISLTPFGFVLIESSNISIIYKDSKVRFDNKCFSRYFTKDEMILICASKNLLLGFLLITSNSLKISVLGLVIHTQDEEETSAGDSKTNLTGKVIIYI